ncbi:MAG: endonuclease/exonuclease/phosphatase family protein [Acidimicrobiia bacterium]
MSDRRRRARDGVVRVATFNIRHGAAGDDHVRPVALLRACAALDPDLLGLQEVERGRRRSWYVDQGRLVAAYLRARSVDGPAIQRNRWRAYGNSLIVRGRVRDVEVLDLPRGPEREPRSAVVATVTVHGLTLAVAVTHLQHRPARLRHLPHDAGGQLRSVLEALAARPRPRILLGDLNLQPPTAVPILEDAGFTVAEHGPTYPADEPRLRLDYVAVDGLRVRDVQIAGAAEVSDHRAVVADLVP